MRHSSPAGIGMITILTVLLTLCLAIFSALTLASAGTDFRLSKVAADKTRAYYAADAKAAQLYADFAAGTDAELETSIPISDTQTLLLQCSRDQQGKAVIDCWRVVVIEVTPDESLPVWTGE